MASRHSNIMHHLNSPVNNLHFLRPGIAMCMHACTCMPNPHTCRIIKKPTLLPSWLQILYCNYKSCNSYKWSLSDIQTTLIFQKAHDSLIFIIHHLLVCMFQKIDDEKWFHKKWGDYQRLHLTVRNKSEGHQCCPLQRVNHTRFGLFYKVWIDVPMNHHDAKVFPFIG